MRPYYYHSYNSTLDSGVNKSWSLPTWVNKYPSKTPREAPSQNKSRITISTADIQSLGRVSTVQGLTSKPHRRFKVTMSKYIRASVYTFKFSEKINSPGQLTGPNPSKPLSPKPQNETYPQGVENQRNSMQKSTWQLLRPCYAAADEVLATNCSSQVN